MSANAAAGGGGGGDGGDRRGGRGKKAPRKAAGAAGPTCPEAVKPELSHVAMALMVLTSMPPVILLPCPFRYLCHWWGSRTQVAGDLGN